TKEFAEVAQLLDGNIGWIKALDLLAQTLLVHLGRIQCIRIVTDQCQHLLHFDALRNLFLRPGITDHYARLAFPGAGITDRHARIPCAMSMKCPCSNKLNGRKYRPLRLIQPTLLCAFLQISYIHDTALKARKHWFRAVILM